jgi:hypothetical protein
MPADVLTTTLAPPAIVLVLAVVTGTDMLFG